MKMHIWKHCFADPAELTFIPDLQMQMEFVHLYNVVSVYKWLYAEAAAALSSGLQQENKTMSNLSHILQDVFVWLEVRFP